MSNVCGCNPDCGLPPCSECGDDHGGIDMGGDRRVCRDCHTALVFRRIAKHEERNPGALAKRLDEVATLFAGKRRD